MMNRGIGHALSSMMSYPVLVGSALIAVISLFLLIKKGNSIKPNVKTLLIILFIVALVLVLFLTIIAFAFGSNHPITPPVPFG